jgi:Protein of unknown function (DUF2934)
MLSTPTHGGSLLRESNQETTLRDSIDEDTRRRAHEIYLSRKAVPGNELDDWLRNERKIRSLAHDATMSKMQSVHRKPRGIHAILRLLRLQQIYVSGPVRERDGTLIFRIGDYIITEAQLVDLMGNNN